MRCTNALYVLGMNVMRERTVHMFYLYFVGSLLPPDDGLGGGDGQLLGHHSVERQGVLEHLYTHTHTHTHTHRIHVQEENEDRLH